MSAISVVYFDLVVVAASAGGLSALTALLRGLSSSFPAAVVIVQHLDPHHPSLMAEILRRRTGLDVHEARDGDALQPCTVFTAPPGHHLLIKADGTLSLSETERVHFVRPSADLLFESAAEASASGLSPSC
jgi:two-component system, chemotaxis family, protein-glutamate methylesterase/glutaminase